MTGGRQFSANIVPSFYIECDHYITLLRSIMCITILHVVIVGGTLWCIPFQHYLGIRNYLRISKNYLRIISDLIISVPVPDH